MEILVLGILILLNGFFALSEIALVSSKRTRLEQLRSAGSSGANRALQLLKNSENFLSAIQVGITLIGIISGVYGGLNLADDVAPLFLKFEFTRDIADELALTLTVIIITFFSILIGELVPKIVALSNPEKTAVRISSPVYYFSLFFFPFVRFFGFSTRIASRILGLKPRTDQLTETELRHLLKLASMEGVIEKEQNILHEKVFYFSDKKAKHIMTPRVEVEWIDISMEEHEIRKDILAMEHSKVLVCKEEPDNFIGILDLLDYFRSQNSNSPALVKDLLCEPIIIPENLEAAKILNLIRNNRARVCIVVNEYGGFEGIITLHDIAESIVGHIPEEGETFEPDVFVREDKSILINGDAPVETLSEHIEGLVPDFNVIDYSTVAGFVMSYLDKIPETGDFFEYQGYRFEIIDMDMNRIDKLLITKIPEK